MGKAHNPKFRRRVVVLNRGNGVNTTAPPYSAKLYPKGVILHVTAKWRGEILSGYYYATGGGWYVLRSEPAEPEPEVIRVPSLTPRLVRRPDSATA